MVYSMIRIKSGPSVEDPKDQAPIIISLTPGNYIHLAAINWRIRLAIWFLRRYVRQATGQK